MSKRMNSVDIAKGIAIILVVLGHTINVSFAGSLPIGIIYSFHMPLFFIAAGLFYKEKSICSIVKAGAKRLLVPYVTINLLRYFIISVKFGFSERINDKYLFPMLYGSGSSGRAKLHIFEVKSVGMTWFLLAMFLCLVIYQLICNFSKKYDISLWGCVFAAFLIGKETAKYIFLPFSIQPALTAVLFYHVGRVMREKTVLEQGLTKTSPLLNILLLSVSIVSMVSDSSVNMSAAAYTNFTVLVVAVYVSWLVIQLSKGIDKIPLIGVILCFCGRHSMLIYCMHVLDSVILPEMKKLVTNIISLEARKGILLLFVIRISAIMLSAVIVFGAGQLVRKLFSTPKTA